MKMQLTALKTDALYAEHVALVSDGVLVERLLSAVKSMVETIAANGPLTARMIKKVAEKATTYHSSSPSTEVAWGLMRESTDRIDGWRTFAGNTSQVTGAGKRVRIPLFVQSERTPSLVRNLATVLIDHALTESRGEPPRSQRMRE
ncbi:hypothetical protein [Paraburkholderia sp. GAS334]|uniref:hypothetical protein n=1 Tax=Paraburkholderia sp. GAS334 TaxID=3035131 RepID=UPI003D2501AE